VTSQPPALSVVLPCLNEEAALRTVVPELLGQLAALRVSHEIIVVDDGSTDGTQDMVRALASTHPHVCLVVHPTNRGYAAALSSGVEAATGDAVLLMDADGQFTAEDIPRCLALLEGHDGVVGYRRDRRDGALRKMLSGGYNRLARGLLGIDIRDANCAFKLLRRSATVAFPLRSNGFLAGAEILARCRAQGLRLAETWVTHRPRVAGASTVRPRHLLEAVLGLLRLRWNLSKTVVPRE
jgi:glycosyltransferase involved in cell wall biosynthesis